MRTPIESSVGTRSSVVAAPPPPPPPTSRTSRRWVWVVALVAALALVAGVVTHVVGRPPDGPRVLVEDRFSGDTSRFSLESDDSVALTIEDGWYRIVVADTTRPQVMRSPFDPVAVAVRFEATVTQVNDSSVPNFFGLGCWRGNHAYVAFITPDGDVGLFDEGLASGEPRQPIGALVHSSAVAPPGSVNEIRVDCIGAAPDVSRVSAWVNGTPVVTATVPFGITSFDAVGFFAWTTRSGTEYRVDDAVATAESPAAPAIDPTGSPTRPVGGVQWFERRGVRFAYPAKWVVSAPFVPGMYRIAPSSGAGQKGVAFMPILWRPTPTKVGVSVAAWFDDLARSSGGRMAGAPKPTRVSGIDGYRATMAGISSPGGRALESQVVLLFGSAETYMLIVLYEPGSADEMLAGWRGVLSTFAVSPQ